MIEYLKLDQSKTIADIGAATGITFQNTLLIIGYFPIRFAKHASKVFAVDIEPNLVNYLKKRVHDEGIQVHPHSFI